MMNEGDNMTETRNSHDKPINFWGKLKNYVCPCLLPKINDIISTDLKNNKETCSVYSRASETYQASHPFQQRFNININESVNVNRMSKRKNSDHDKREVLIIKNTRFIQKSFRQTINIGVGYNNRLDEMDCSVCNLTQNQLLSVGIKNRHLLVKVTRANVNANLSLLKKQMRNGKKNQKHEGSKYEHFQFHKFWNHRYILFEKFDEGIKIDENSWSKIPPEQISEYIASKCNGAKVILDAFAGVGGTSIKLANVNSCVKVIANDYNKKKTSFLLNNAKVYQVDNRIQLSEQNFLKIQKRNIDIVFVDPPMIELSIGHKNISITDFSPSLDKIIMKSMGLAPNLIMLLPPEISLDVLCSCLNKCATEIRKMRQLCSIKIEKIYYQNQIKYVLVCVGTLVQTEIKLNDQLQYMYSKLKRPDEKYFPHKKVLKKIREDHGMLQLFNIVKESQRRTRQIISTKNEAFSIDIFYDIIRQKRLISQQKLVKFILEQKLQFQRQSSYFTSLNNDHPYQMSPIMEEQKMNENPFNLDIREAELTQSQYSHYSGVSGQKNSQDRSGKQTTRLMRQDEPYIIINRINDLRQEIQGNGKQSPITGKLKRRTEIELNIKNENYKNKDT